MARFGLNLKLGSIEDFSMLLHGGPGAGKTHLIGDALAFEAAVHGIEKVGYINIAGQDGWLSLAEYDLEGCLSETVDTYDSFLEVVREYAGLGLACVGVDSLRDVVRLASVSVTGLDKMPEVGKFNNDWSEIHFKSEIAVREMNKSASRVITVCTSDRSVDQLTGKVNITPDLPGRQARGIASSFDFVGYMYASNFAGRTKRLVAFKPMTVSLSKSDEIEVVTRSRLARGITSDIEIAHGKGGWAEIINVFTEHLSVDESETAGKPAKKWSKK
jgi:hypothetical protein